MEVGGARMSYYWRFPWYSSDMEAVALEDGTTGAAHGTPETWRG